MKNFRLGHVNKIFVRVGDEVKKGDKIATNGNANGKWLAHCHLDGFYEFDDPFFYNIGWSKEATDKKFFDTTSYSKIVMPSFDHYGLEWLQWHNYGTASRPRASWHPGVDLNGPGAGNADFDEPLHAPCDGKVKFVGARSDWGNIIIIEEKMSEKNHDVKEIMKVAKSHLDIDAGNRINKREDDEIAGAIINLVEENKRLKNESDEKYEAGQKSVVAEINKVLDRF